MTRLGDDKKRRFSAAYFNDF